MGAISVSLRRPLTPLQHRCNQSICLLYKKLRSVKKTCWGTFTQPISLDEQTGVIYTPRERIHKHARL